MASVIKIKDESQNFICNVFLIDYIRDTIFSILYQHEILHESTHPRNVRAQAQKEISAVQKTVLANPPTSTRAIGRDLHMEHTKVHSILKHDLKWHSLRNIRFNDCYLEIFLSEKYL